MSSEPRTLATPPDDLGGLAQFASISPVGIFRCDREGRNVFVNSRWSEITGWPAESAHDYGWEKAMHPDDLPWVREWWKSLVRGEARTDSAKVYRGEARYVKPDGETVWTHCELVEERDASGQVVGYLGTITDVSELHLVKQQLEELTTQLEQRVAERTQQWRELVMIIEQTDDAIIWSDLAGRIIGWNQGAEKMFGYTRAEVLGGSTLALTPPEDQGAAIEIKRRVRLGEEVHHREVVRVAKGGRRIPALISVFPLRNESGSIMGSAAIIRDLTAQKKAESRFRNLSQRLLGAQDEERRRIARELHDSTAQLLVALSISLNRLCMQGSNLTEETRAQLLSESCMLAERATGEVRTQSYLLHPPLLEERGLVAALHFFIDGFIDRSGITVRFQARSQVDRLDPLVELTLFRIVQEALANVHRHSQSQRVEITLEADADWIQLTVRDFGTGLQSDPTELKGVGIAGMRERAAQLGGSFELESANPGLKLALRLPLNPTL